MSKSHTNFAEQKDFLCNSLALFFLCNFLALIFLCNFLDLDFEWRRKQAKSKRGRSMMGSACKGRITEEFGSGGGENGRPRCDSRGIDRASGLAPSTQLKALPWHMTRPVSAGEVTLNFSISPNFSQSGSSSSNSSRKKILGSQAAVSETLPAIPRKMMRICRRNRSKRTRPLPLQRRFAHPKIRTLNFSPILCGKTGTKFGSTAFLLCKKFMKRRKRRT